MAISDCAQQPCEQHEPNARELQGHKEGEAAPGRGLEM